MAWGSSEGKSKVMFEKMLTDFLNMVLNLFGRSRIRLGVILDHVLIFGDPRDETWGWGRRGFQEESQM